VRVAADGRYTVSLQVQERSTTSAWDGVTGSGSANEEPTLSSLTGTLNYILSEETKNRVAIQAEQLFGVKNLFSQNPSPAQAPSFGVNGGTMGKLGYTGSLKIDSYLQLIRSLSGDDKTLQDFLDQLDAFLSQSDNTGAGSSATTRIATQTQAQAATQAQTAAQAQTANAAQTTQRNAEAITFNIRMEGGRVIVEEVRQQQADPLVFDLNNNGIELTSAQNGVRFQIDGKGVDRRTAFVSGGDAFLALDRNGNGVIDSGRELFGDQQGAKNGIEELRKFDENRDGIIDKRDSVFNQLLLYRENNGDGVSQPGELKSLEQHGIAAIHLSAANENRSVAGNNWMDQSITYQRKDGTTGMVGEVLLNYLA